MDFPVSIVPTGHRLGTAPGYWRHTLRPGSVGGDISGGTNKITAAGERVHVIANVRRRNSFPSRRDDNNPVRIIVRRFVRPSVPYSNALSRRNIRSAATVVPSIITRLRYPIVVDPYRYCYRTREIGHIVRLEHGTTSVNGLRALSARSSSTGSSQGHCVRKFERSDGKETENRGTHIHILVMQRLNAIRFSGMVVGGGSFLYNEKPTNL